MTASTRGRRLPQSRPAAVVTFALMAFAASGCGGGESAPPNSVQVSETEYAMTPANADPESIGPDSTITSTAKVGKVVFQISNDGEETHSFVFNNAGKEIPLGRDLAPGESAEMTVKVNSTGYYEYYCPLDGHQDKGMQGQLEVVE